MFNLISKFNALDEDKVKKEWYLINLNPTQKPRQSHGASHHSDRLRQALGM